MIQKQGVIKGLGVSSGYAIGKVFFYGQKENNSNDPIVMVVRELSRNIVTSLPENVCAVISQNGSVGCHGAGLLREKKIPCVVRVQNIFEIFSKNEMVEVVGSTGTVFILDRMNKKSNNWTDSIIIDETEKCYRPNRIYQKLRFDILKDGWENSPKYLFGLPKCKLRLVDNIIYVSNGPNLENLRNVLVENPDECFLIAKKRSIDIQRIKGELVNIQQNINYSKMQLVYEQFHNCIILYHELLKYVYITQFVSDDLTDELIDIIDEFDIGSQYKDEYIKSKLKSDYVLNSVINKIDPGLSTTWKIPCSEPYIWDGVIDWRRELGDYRLNSKIFASTEENGFDFYKKYASLSLIVPILYQLAEEHYFVSSSICSFLNKYIEVLAKVLVEKKVITSMEDILQMPLDFVISEFEKLI